jgi:arsenate reductase
VAFNYVLDLYDASVSDDQLIDPVIKRPILINGPIVQTPTGVRMRRRVEKALKFFLAA